MAAMPSLRSFLINRDYARLWTGQAVSTVGDFVFDTTVLLWVGTVLVEGRSWAPAAVGGVALSVGAAILVVGPLAGVFVDRWNRRATMLRTEVIRAVLVVGLTAVSLLPRDALPLWMWLAVVYVVLFALNAAGQFFAPARFAMIGDLVPGEVDRTRAAGLGQATLAVASIIGPPLAAPLLFSIGLQWALILNGLTYVVSYVAIRGIRPPAARPAPDVEPAAELTPPQPTAERTTWWGEFVAGWRFFMHSRVLVTLLIAAVICQLGTGSLNTLNLFFLSTNLHASPKLLGFLEMAFGVGAILGSLMAARAAKLLGTRTVAWAGLVVAGILVVAYAKQTAFVPGLVLILLVALPVAMLNTALTPLLLGATPPQLVGRVAAVFNPLNQLASMLSAGLAGWLVSSALRDLDADVAGLHFGRFDAAFTLAGVLIALAGGYAALALPRPERRQSDQRTSLSTTDT
jgi:MFS family permease